MTTGTVLLSKNADTPLPPASMSKLMTLYVAFEAMRDGRLSLDEKLPVSERDELWRLDDVPGHDRPGARRGVAARV